MIFLLTLFIHFSFADEITVDPKFEAHMLDHMHKGCPENSTCSKDNGKKMGLFKKALKTPKKMTSFIKKYGLPINVWTHGILKSDSDFIQWDPKELTFKRPDVALYPALVFTKNLKSLKTKKEYVPSHLYYLAGKTLKKRANLRGDFPISMSKDKFYYLQEIDGIYYNIALKSNGSLHFYTKLIKPKFQSEFIRCPAPLKEQYKKYLEKNPTHLKSYYCKSLTDTHTKVTKAYLWPRP